MNKTKRKISPPLSGILNIPEENSDINKIPVENNKTNIFLKERRDKISWANERGIFQVRGMCLSSSRDQDKPFLDFRTRL